MALAVFASISEARVVQKREVRRASNEKDSKEVKDEGHLVTPDNIEEEKEEEKHEQSKEEEIDKEHANSKEDSSERDVHREGSKDKGTDADRSDELSGEFIAIVAILIDPDTHKPHLIAQQMPHSSDIKALL